MARWALLASCVAGLAGCEASPSEQALAQAAALDRAAEQLRNAPNPDKRRYLEAFQKLACSGEALCAFKRTCEEGYEKHVAAFEKIRSVKARLQASPPALLRATLEQSRRELLAAAKATDACVASQSQIRKDFRLR